MHSGLYIVGEAPVLRWYDSVRHAQVDEEDVVRADQGPRAVIRVPVGPHGIQVVDLLLLWAVLGSLCKSCFARRVRGMARHMQRCSCAGVACRIDGTGSTPRAPWWAEWGIFAHPRQR